eukprot:scaffold30236_cov69-Phaeocystis_antarctica.AAC.2
MQGSGAAAQREHRGRPGKMTVRVARAPERWSGAHGGCDRCSCAQKDRAARASYHTLGLSITTARCYCGPTLSSEAHGPDKVPANVAHIGHACGGQG